MLPVFNSDPKQRCTEESKTAAPPAAAAVGGVRGTHGHVRARYAPGFHLKPPRLWVNSPKQEMWSVAVFNMVKGFNKTKKIKIKE